MVMYTCPERRFTRAATLASLGRTDWRADFRLVVDVGPGSPSLTRMAATFVRALDAAASSKADAVLLVEDDLRFNVHLQHNLEQWLASFGPAHVGSLYRSSLARNVGTQAIIATPVCWRRLWNEARATSSNALQPLDSWLHTQVPPQRFRFHEPSLVQHSAHSSTCSHPQHHSQNFDEHWRA